MVDIELHRTVDEHDPEVTGWTAHWQMGEASRGRQDHDEDLAALLTAILTDLAPLGEYYTLTLAWQLGGQAPAGHTVAEAVAATGLSLPTRLPREYA
ncbi:hypothetical protein [Bounagaea algeriensis]